MTFSDDGSKLMMYCDNPNEGQYSSEFDEILLYALDYEKQEFKLLNLNLTQDRFRAYFSSFTLSGNGNYLAAGADGKVFLWDFTDVIMRQRQISVTANAMAFSADGRLLAVANWSEDLIYIYETATAKQLAAFAVEVRVPVNQLLFSPDDKSLYVRTGDAVSVWGVP
jgi:WD40 repeat protein